MLSSVDPRCVLFANKRFSLWPFFCFYLKTCVSGLHCYDEKFVRNLPIRPKKASRKTKGQVRCFDLFCLLGRESAAFLETIPWFIIVSSVS